MVCWLVGGKCVKGKLSQINIRQLQTVLNIKISTSLVEFIFVLNLDFAEETLLSATIVIQALQLLTGQSYPT